MKYQVLLLLKATPKWLGLSKAYREKTFTDVVYPLFQSFSATLNIQVFSSEAFHATISDVLNIETDNIQAYYQFLQDLKGSRIIGEEYFEIHDIIVGIENGFRKFNEEARLNKALVLN